MEELAEKVADQDGVEEDSEALLDRWDGRPDFVIEDLFQVRDLETKEVTNLELTDYQRQFVHAFWYGDESTLAVLKGRRTGYSFIACAVILLYCLTTEHSFVAITGPSKSQAKDRIEDIYDLIDWSRIEIELEIDNRDEIELWNGSTMMAFAGNPDTSRGADSADILFIDEMDFLEDQEESMRAFSPFVALGDANTIEISTPQYSNSLFQDDIERGSEAGEHGIIAIEQPAFENPDEIDEEVSLLEQDVEPVMPYLNLMEAEKDRQRDPKGFRQEYLCETIEDSYRFFTESGIERAMRRGERDSYVWHPATHAREGGMMVMGVDLGADGKDDTAISVWEHVGGKRLLRFHTVVSERDLDEAGVRGDPRNPSDLADYTEFLADNMGVERVFVDKTGTGKGYWREISAKLGRRASGIQFDDKEMVAEMMGDFNYGLHNDQITMVKDETISQQLKAIVKKQTHETSKPRFSGKEHAPNGKDDLAIALVLGAYPPSLDNNQENQATEPVQRNQAYSTETPGRFTDEEQDSSDEWQGVVQRNPFDSNDSGSSFPIGSSSSSRRVNERYDSRHERAGGR